MEVMPHGNSKMIRKHYNYEVQKIKKSFFSGKHQLINTTEQTNHDKKYFEK
jgi:hypothetical protein